MGIVARKFFKPTFIVALLVGFVLAGYLLNNQSADLVENGYVDLTNVDFDSTAIILSGNWEFYGNRLMEPKDFKEQNRSVPDCKASNNP